MSDSHTSGTKPADQASVVGRREVFAWAMYDWANSAYSALSITILVYYIKAVVLPGEAGTRAWGWGIGGSMLCAAVLSPVIGALADARANKRTWLALSTGMGVAATFGIALVAPTHWWLIVALFFVTSFSFEISLGFYNGFLPEIADESTMNRVSAFGFAMGYVGGGLALAIAILVMFLGPAVGVDDRGDQLRIGLVIMGLWWGVFSLPALLILRDRGTPARREGGVARAAIAGFAQVAQTLRNVRRYRSLFLFLIAFLIYNDGVQTVISQSSVFAIEVLKIDPQELILIVLMIQFAALPGALIIGRMADRIGQKRALHFCLAIWAGLLVAAYFVTTNVQFWCLGVVLALVMGGTQSVSRAIMGAMTPKQHTAEFFGFFNLSGKATSMFGPILFAEIVARTGSAHLAILSLLIFILGGWALFARLDLRRGRAEARAA